MKRSNFKWSAIVIFTGLALISIARVFNSYLDRYVARLTSSPRSSPPTLKKFTNSIGMQFVHLPGGTFKMGDGASDQPVHDVTISPFWIGQYEVTNAEYDGFKKQRYRGPASPTGQHPVMFLSWQEANAFCKWLSKREKRKYRLPTEAEWEYAARGGLEQKTYPWGNEDPEKRATFGVMTTTPVGSYPPNGFGLCDVAGNAEEWVSDWYAEDYYADSPIQDPQGPLSGESKVTRGGLFMALEISCATRLANPPDLTKLPPPYTGDVNLPGFRVALDAPINLANQ